MSKLLNKPLKAFTLYALIILVCSIPVYFLVVDFIWQQELDEHNQIVKERIVENFKLIKTSDEELGKTLVLWNILQPGTKLIKVDENVIKKDSVYTITKASNYTNDAQKDRFRVLESYLKINKKNYFLSVETNVEEADETLLAIAIVTFIFFSLLVVGFVLLNKRISKKIWLPFQNTLEKLKNFDLSTHKSIEFIKTDIEEFEQLNQELSKLILKNISVFDQQKVFLENASHELQTPLAVLKSKIDSLLQSKNLSSDQLDLINQINVPLARASRINKNLLLLSKIENHQFEDKEVINFESVLTDSLTLLEDYIIDKQLSISQSFENNDQLLTNKVLIEVLVNNLLINSIKHTENGGKIVIELKNGILIVKNSGITPLNHEGMFNRFLINSNEPSNSGLGLAIVKEIANRYHWKIAYDFKNQMHQFSVVF
ncbi:sensor histidine kinase [Pedobacter cryophilus]|uniref:sensor histidine kinase n=1 Tax=Pedobacter cryophilus TaxID=2571271 RepID=UPI00145CCCCC|nr:HAMP domain-containing sensor histidine kinase [Pedobacter cryophilus]